MCDQYTFNRRDIAEIAKCPSCDNCHRDTTQGDFPVQYHGKSASGEQLFCIIRYEKCDMYYVDGKGTVRNSSGVDGNSAAAYNVKVPTVVKTTTTVPVRNYQPTPAQAQAQAQAPTVNNNNKSTAGTTVTPKTNTSPISNQNGTTNNNNNSNNKNSSSNNNSSSNKSNNNNVVVVPSNPVVSTPSNNTPSNSNNNSNSNNKSNASSNNTNTTTINKTVNTNTLNNNTTGSGASLGANSNTNTNINTPNTNTNTAVNTNTGVTTGITTGVSPAVNGASNTTGNTAGVGANTAANTAANTGAVVGTTTNTINNTGNSNTNGVEANDVPVGSDNNVTFSPDGMGTTEGVLDDTSGISTSDGTISIPSTTNGSVDNNTKNIGVDDSNNNGVSPYLIGGLSLFSVFLIVVGFLYIRKRKRDKEEDVDLIYNNSIFYATPIVEKQNSQRSNKSNKSNRSKLSLAANQTAISSKDDGDFDILISPTNAAVVNNNPPVPTNRGPINTYADTSAVADTEVEGLFSESNTSLLHQRSESGINSSYLQQPSESGINVSSTENFISQSNINNYNGVTMTTTSGVISPSMLSPTSAIEPSNIMVPTTTVGEISEDLMSPLVPAGLTQNITVHNASMTYDVTDVSMHEPSISFINSNNGFSFSEKDDSYVISPIMDKSTSNLYVNDMTTENSINTDLKQITSTPKLNSKKTLSMVISEYKEDSLYYAKFNYEPSMEDEMRIRINDRVLVKEIFNDGWAYGENKTTESFGIFPINRLDSSSS